MARLRYNGLSTMLGASLTSSATAVTFAAALTHSGGTNVPTISGSDYIPLTILDATGKASEIVNLTAYTAGSTTGTITRAQESTSGVSHASADKVVHAPTVQDIQSGGGLELAYAEITSAFSTTSATDVAVPGMTITVTVGSRPVWVEAAFPYVTVTGAADGTATMSLYQGATQIGFTGSQVPANGGAAGGPRLRRRIPAGSGTLTFSVQVAGTTGMTKAFQAAANNPAYITANEIA